MLMKCSELSLLGGGAMCLGKCLGRKGHKEN